jgi:signal transduction histidine kinase
MRRLTSIRWSLPFSYAAIALLGALCLGLVLLTTLRGYYDELERENLTVNAKVVGRALGRFLETDQPVDTIEPQLRLFAFMSQTHIRASKGDGQMLADVGGDDSVLTVSYTPNNQFLIRSDSDAPGSAGETFQMPVSPLRLREIVGDWGVAPTPDANPGPIIGPQEAPSDTHPYPPEKDIVYSVAIKGEPTVFGPTRRTTLVSSERSPQHVSVDIRDTNDRTIGHLEISGGPAIGTEIVEGVSQALLKASAVAVLMAAGVGFVVSRYISKPLLALNQTTTLMAAGNLAARATIRRNDEFGQLSRSFNDMASRVETTVTTLRRFVADAAHELHTPLTALYANLELAADEQDIDEKSTFIQRAQEQVRRLENLTNNLLDLSRIETRSTSIERVEVDLVTLVRETSELYASQAEQAGITFCFDVPEGPIIAQVNEAQLRRAICNLLDNAIKFTPEDGRVSIGLRPSASYVELWVRDTGIGIPPDELPQLFSRFHRGRNAANYPGNGLGLAIIKAIIEGHKGQVQVESGAQGTYFSLQLPIVS